MKRKILGAIIPLTVTGFLLSVLLFTSCASNSTGVVSPNSTPAGVASPIKTANGNLSGNWTGTWTNSLGESGNEILQITDNGSGTFTGVWSGNIEINGEWLTGTTFEFSGSTATRSYEAQGSLQNNNITLTYTAARLDASGSYTGQERLTQQNSRAASAITSTSAASMPGEVLAKQRIGTSGGTITIDNPSSPLDGFKLAVPAGALTSSQTFQVAYQDAPDLNYKGITDVSPLITIDDGGVFTNEPVYVQIPVKIPQGDFAMAFYYDANSGLEGIPLLAEDDNSITVATCRFSSFMCLSISLQMLQDAEALSSGIQTGFKPGQDDWNIPNYGSYITPGGNCAGTSMSEIWYFDQVVQNSNSSGVSHLNGSFAGEDASIWQDANLAYRLVSSVQNDYKAEHKKLLADVNNTSLEIHSTMNDATNVYNAFAFSMMITNQPQLIGVDGHDDSTNEAVGHEMVAYAVSKDGIMVDDPNDRQGHLLSFIDGKLSSFDDSDTTWDVFYYDAKGALLPWDKIGARWQELYAGTIGNDVFPAYELTITDKNGNTWDASKYDLKNSITASSSEITVKINSQEPLAITLYDGNSRSWLSRDSQGHLLTDETGTFDLNQGNNMLGIYVVGTDGNYVDFKWVSINYGATTTTVPTTIVPPATQADATIDTISAKLLNKQGTDYYYMVTVTGTASGPVGTGFAASIEVQAESGGYATEDGYGDTVYKTSWTGVEEGYNDQIRLDSEPATTTWTFSVPIRISAPWDGDIVAHVQLDTFSSGNAPGGLKTIKKSYTITGPP